MYSFMISVNNFLAEPYVFSARPGVSGQGDQHVADDGREEAGDKEPNISYDDEASKF